MNYLTSLILTGNDLASNPATSNNVLRPVQGQEFRGYLIYCDCDIIFQRQNTLNNLFHLNLKDV